MFDRQIVKYQKEMFIVIFPFHACQPPIQRREKSISVPFFAFKKTNCKKSLFENIVNVSICREAAWSSGLGRWCYNSEVAGSGPPSCS